MCLRVTCPCGRRYRTEVKNSGKRFVCPKCLQMLQVPEASAQILPLPQPTKRLCRLYLSSVQPCSTAA